MARGWESKSVEAQQEDASRGRVTRRTLTETERAVLERRRTLELTRTRAAAELSRATAAAHRSMLEQTIAAIDEQIEQLTADTRRTSS
jgi:hypothetical protein